MHLREQSIPRLGRRSKAYYGARLERELLAAFDQCPERNFIVLDQKEVATDPVPWSPWFAHDQPMDFSCDWVLEVRTMGLVVRIAQATDHCRDYRTSRLGEIVVLNTNFDNQQWHNGRSRLCSNLHL